MKRRSAELQVGHPQARAGEVGRDERRPRPAGQPEPLAGARAAERGAVAAQLDQAALGVRQRGGDVQGKRRPVGARGHKRGRQRGGGVDDHQIARRQDLRQVADASVADVL